MTAASDKVLTRALTSLVNANEGLVVDNALTPGTSTVQLGAIVDGTNPIDVGRFVTFTGATPSLTYDGTGTMNLGTTGNLALNINTGTQPMTVQGTTLAAAAAATPAASKFHNIVYVDETSHAVQTVTAANMARNDAPTDFVAIDPATGNFVKAVSPTAGVTRGQIAGTGAFQYTSPAINIAANASITCTIENHTGVLGAIVVQVTNVTTGAAGTFSVESSESIQAGSFINYIVMN
jgi:hypothetical protein